MGGFQHVYLSGQCGQIILLALPAHCPPHCTALPSIIIAHSQVTCEFASFVAEFISRSLFHSLVRLPSLSYFAMAQIPATRRELQQRSLPQLKALAEELVLPSSGRKSAIIDRLYRHHRQAARDNGPTGSRSRSPSAHPSETQTPTRTQSQQTPAHLERTVQQLVDRSLQGLEERLLFDLPAYTCADREPLATGGRQHIATVPSAPAPGRGNAGSPHAPNRHSGNAERPTYRSASRAIRATAAAPGQGKTAHRQR